VLHEAMEAELGRLLAEGEIRADLAGGGAVPSLTTKGFQTDHAAGPVQLGRQIAGAVYRGLAK